MDKQYPDVVALSFNHDKNNSKQVDTSHMAKSDVFWWLCFVLLSVSILATTLIIFLSRDLEYMIEEAEDDSIRTISGLTDTMFK